MNAVQGTAEADSTVRKLLKNSISSVLTKLLQLTVLVWVNQYLLKRIAPEEYSLFPVVVSLVVFAELFKNIFTGGIGRFVVEADARGDNEGVTRIVSSMLPALLIVAVLLGLVGGVAVWNIDRIIEIEPAYLADARVMLTIAMSMLCIGVLNTPFSLGLYVRQRFHVINLLDLACEALRIVLLLVLFSGAGTRVIWLVVASACSGLVRMWVAVWYTRKLIPAIQFKRKLICGATARKLMAFGAWTSTQGITNLVASTIPLLILNRFGTAVDVAAFHIGRMPDLQIRRLLVAAMAPSQPVLTSTYARNGEGSLNDLYYRGGRYHLWIALAVIAPLVVFGREVINLYAGSKYGDAAAVMAALLCVYPITWASAMFYRVSHAIGRVGAYYVCDIVLQTVMVTCIYYLVALRGMGAIGTGLAIGLSGGLLHLALIWPMGLRLIGGQWNRFIRHTLLPGNLPFVVSLVFCYSCREFLNVHSWLRLASLTILAIGVYVLVLVMLCLDASDRNLLRKLGHRMRRVFRPAASISSEHAVGVSPHITL